MDYPERRRLPQLRTVRPPAPRMTPPNQKGTTGQVEPADPQPKLSGSDAK